MPTASPLFFAAVWRGRLAAANRSEPADVLLDRALDSFLDASLKEGRRLRVESQRLRAEARRLQVEAERLLLDCAEALVAGTQTVERGKELVGDGQAAPRVRVEASKVRGAGGEWRENRLEILKGLVEKGSSPAHLDDLTRRQIEVLKCIAEGHSTKQVAGIMGISFKTAACHRYKIMEKLGIHDTATLVRYAVRNGIVHA